MTLSRSLTDEGTVTFNCTADGIPQPRISWRRNGQFLNINQLRRYSVNTTTNNGSHSTELPGVQQTKSKLTIKSLREIDNGTFSCIAQSATTPPAALLVPFQLNIEIRKFHHTCSVMLIMIILQLLRPIIVRAIHVKMMEHVKTSVINFHVIVLHVSQDIPVLLVSKLLCNAVSFISYVLVVRDSFKPVITTQPMNITGDLFSAVNLTCIADEGYPEPEIIWYKDGTKLRTPSSPNTLVIEELIPSDRGFYYCEAVNVAGTAISNTVLVNIKG